MGYPSDISDEAWAEVEPHLPRQAATGRPRTVDLRQVLNAIRYKNRTGCQWDSLPDGFPAKSTVFDYFQKWNEDGTLLRINDLLRVKVREKMGRQQEPSIAIVDSQSVKTTHVGGDSGFDAGKKYQGSQTSTHR